MSNDDSSFGATVRRLREEKKIGLRKFAQMVGMSPTYLSKVERDEFKPPSRGEGQGHRRGSRPGRRRAARAGRPRVVGSGRHHPAPPARDGDFPAGGEWPVCRGDAASGRGGPAAQERGRDLTSRAVSATR